MSKNKNRGNKADRNLKASFGRRKLPSPYKVSHGIKSAQDGVARMQDNKPKPEDKRPYRL